MGDINISGIYRKICKVIEKIGKLISGFNEKREQKSKREKWS